MHLQLAINNKCVFFFRASLRREQNRGYKVLLTQSCQRLSLLMVCIQFWDSEQPQFSDNLLLSAMIAIGLQHAVELLTLLSLDRERFINRTHHCLFLVAAIAFWYYALPMTMNKTMSLFDAVNHYRCIILYFSFGVFSVYIKHARDGEQIFRR